MKKESLNIGIFFPSKENPTNGALYNWNAISKIRTNGEDTAMVYLNNGDYTGNYIGMSVSQIADNLEAAGVEIVRLGNGSIQPAKKTGQILKR